METLTKINKPTKSEQKAALASYGSLLSVIGQLHEEQTEIEIEETNDKIIVPLRALKLFVSILKTMSEGKPISVVPLATAVTTQKAAEILGCSRPHLVKLLEEGEIQYIKIGKHRRIRFEDVMEYKKQMKATQKQYLIDMMNSDEDLEKIDS